MTSLQATDIDEISASIETITETALKLGLKPPAVEFEIVPAEIMYELAAYVLPTRFSHWTYGTDYYKMKTQYDYGVSKIYELVINTEPAKAYLMENNSLTTQKLVIAHVLGHVDFFRRNIWYRGSNLDIVETAKAHTRTLLDFENEYGFEEVEKTLDAALALSAHVKPTQHDVKDDDKHQCEHHSSEYDDIWHLTGHQCDCKQKKRDQKFPKHPEYDLLLFLAEHSPILLDWQRTVLHIVREERLYFLSNIKTKTMNEGYATFWHERILENSDLTPDEHIAFRRLHSGVIGNSSRFSTNPYGLGYQIWRDIERRYNEKSESKTWYGSTVKCEGDGLAKIFEIASEYRDSDFIRGFLTKELVESCDLFTYAPQTHHSFRDWVVEDRDWEAVRDKLADDLLLSFVPSIAIINANAFNHRELFLTQDNESDRQGLDHNYVLQTLPYLFQLWGSKCYLVCQGSDSQLMYSVDESGVKL